MNKSTKTAATETEKLDVYQKVTDSIIAALEGGKIPWVNPWIKNGPQRNGATGRKYNGINVLMTWLSALENGFSSNEWFTFKQASAKGGKIIKGSKGTLVVYYMTLKLDKNGKRLPDDAPRSEVDKEIFTAKGSIVFNRDQIEGLPAIEFNKSLELSGDSLGQKIIDAHNIDFTIEGDRAFYRPSTDSIKMPDLHRFNGENPVNDFWAVAFHEITHWTGHESRMNRPLCTQFGSESYSAEELCAELGASFLCAEAGFEPTLNHAAYIQNWLTALRNDKKYIFKAASDAQKAVTFIMDKIKPAEESVPESDAA